MSPYTLDGKIPWPVYPASRGFLSCRFFLVVFLRLLLPYYNGKDSRKKTTKEKQQDKKTSASRVWPVLSTVIKMMTEICVATVVELN